MFRRIPANFGLIPGQNALAITNHMTEFYFDSCNYTMDLSGKKLMIRQVGPLVRGFVLGQPMVALVGLNLSGNGVSDVPFYENTLSLLTSLQMLGLSSNGIDAADSNVTQALGRELSSLASLRVLDLSNNGIGFTDSLRTQAIGNSLSSLSNLSFLNLASNHIGFKDPEGPAAILAALPRLTALTS